MHRSDDFARLRSSVGDAQDAADAPGNAPVGGSPRRACRTTHTTTYPTGANKFVLVEEYAISGTETEGSTVVETATGRKWLAACLGTIPTEGTKVEVDYVRDRWIFLP
jgi:hypothetical protein